MQNNEVDSNLWKHKWKCDTGFDVIFMVVWIARNSVRTRARGPHKKRMGVKYCHRKIKLNDDSIESAFWKWDKKKIKLQHCSCNRFWYSFFLLRRHPIACCVLCLSWRYFQTTTTSRSLKFDFLFAATSHKFRWKLELAYGK